MTRRQNAPVPYNQLGGNVQRLRPPVDIGGRVVDGNLYSRVGLLNRSVLRGVIPSHISVQRFKNCTQRYQHTTVQDGRRHIGLQRAAIYIQVNSEDARQQHCQRKQHGAQILFHGAKSPLIGLLIV